eukprot:m.886804 g.886804  ORF g.886804 m.886804 type:complete len:838 (-) comp59914_c0_seq1:102-2615(-)
MRGWAWVLCWCALLQVHATVLDSAALFPSATVCQQSFDAATKLGPAVGLRLSLHMNVSSDTLSTDTTKSLGQQFTCLFASEESNDVYGIACDHLNTRLWFKIFHDGRLCLGRDLHSCLAIDHTMLSNLRMSTVASEAVRWVIPEDGRLHLLGTTKCLGAMPGIVPSIQYTDVFKTLVTASGGGYRLKITDCADTELKAVAIHRRPSLDPIKPSDLDPTVIYNFTTFVPSLNQVYVFMSHSTSFPLQVEDIILTTRDELSRLGNVHALPFYRAEIAGLMVSTFEKQEASLGCEFVPLEGLPFEPLQTRMLYYYRHLATTNVICEAPPASLMLKQDSVMSDFKVRIVAHGHAVATAETVTRTLPLARSPKHTLCSCLVLYKRAEFLLEYLSYHTQVHGVGHTIVMAGDDESLQAASWLRAYYNLEVIYWPYLASQSTMAAYCSLLSSNYCEWVLQSDIDELFVTPNHTPLVSILKNAASNVASISAPRVSLMRYEDEILLKIPPGGVIRNYLCPLAQAGIKPILNLRNTHHLFANIGLRFAGNPGTKFEEMQEHVGVFGHYDTQAWELVFLKYARDATLGEGYRGTVREINIDVPEPDYLVKAANCKVGTAPYMQLRDTWWSAVAYRHTGTEPLSLTRSRHLITGTFGEDALLRTLQAHVPTLLRSHLVVDSELATRKHVNLFRQEAVSLTEEAFGFVVHLTSDPLRAISEMAAHLRAGQVEPLLLFHTTMPQYHHHPQHTVATQPVTRAMYWWLTSTLLLDMYVDKQVRLEDAIGSGIQGSGWTFEISGEARLELQQSLRKAVDVSWGDLEAADGFVARIACKAALRQGYACPLLSAQ